MIQIATYIYNQLINNVGRVEGNIDMPCALT